MKRILIILLLFGVNSSFYGQEEYIIFNDIYKESNTIIYLEPFFIESKEFQDYFNKDFFKNNWSPIPSDTTPNINEFLAENNFEYLKEQITQSPNSRIKFEKLNPRIRKKNNNKNYIKISKLIFNKKENWVVFYTYTVYSANYVGSSSYFIICKKENSVWKIYHKILVLLG
ncbi:hypothetical protein LL279_00725 [Zunongwangia profunda]|nr:hypothetical protein [Flavobacteriaceae bacterium]MCC4226708.1 hypothetical protein [Zunongwangia profunda]|tara:strand:- start:263 stop:775 length:513 start_codon:yes stop_codon:yes gene_type:complete